QPPRARGEAALRVGVAQRRVGIQAVEGGLQFRQGRTLALGREEKPGIIHIAAPTTGQALLIMPQRDPVRVLCQLRQRGGSWGWCRLGSGAEQAQQQGKETWEHARPAWKAMGQDARESPASTIAGR